ncbi:putative membrane protein YccC [Leucobacter exalbidus]|uniref:Membrane protein YccC n=1 Tax=Leucobacter exalbidus TaxID=662960 RepID=A0A940PT23_9MICO|nr:FUSC family protein [Leucobacter exalbidus]MBP1326307.1 putative membrane protein YccC [Leucobacter exalbidus]
MNQANAANHSWRDAGGAALRSLFRLPPGPGGRAATATRTALALGIPLLIATILGHQEIGLQAAGGAFTAIYASGMNTRERAKVLPIVALLLFAAACAGVALSPWPWAVAIGLVVVTIVFCAIAFAFRLGPPGPVFIVLVYGLSANVTAVHDGVRRNDPWIYLALFLCGTLTAYLVSISPLVMKRVRQAAARPLSELLPGPWLGSGGRILVLRVTIVAVVGLAVSLLWLDPSRAYWTVATGVTVVGLVAVRELSLSRGLHRVVGTLIGAVLFFAIAPLGAYPWVMLVILVGCQFSIEFVVARNYALALVLITPLVLFINEIAAGISDVSTIAGERVVDTIVGAAIAMLTMGLHGLQKQDPSDSA